MPLIHGADGAKLSKRHGAQGVEEYRAMGYLPLACATISCASAGATATTRSCRRKQLIEWFDIDDINKSASRLDFKKLDDLNGHYIRAATDEELADQVRGMLPHLDFKALAATPTDPKAPPRPDIALAAEVQRQLPEASRPATTSRAVRSQDGWEKFARAIPAFKERSKTLPNSIGGALFHRRRAADQARRQSGEAV